MKLDTESMDFNRLRNELKVKNDELFLYYFYYGSIRLMMLNDERFGERVIKRASVGLRSVVYSIYVDFVLFFLAPNIPLVNINCDRRFQIVDQGCSSGMRKWLELLSIKRIDFRRYLKGVAKRQGLFKVLLNNRHDSYSEAWENIKLSEARSNASRFEMKLSSVFKRVGAKELYFVDLSDTIYAACAFVSKGLGLKNTVIPHGYIQNYSELYTYASVSSRYICWSSSEAKVIRSYFPDVEALYLGCPIYSEEFVESFRNERSLKLLSLGRKKIVFFANPISLSPDPELALDVISLIGDEMRSRNIDFLVKLHPWDRGTEIQGMLSELKVGVVDGTVVDVAINANLVLGFQSTTLYESAVLGVKAIQLLGLKGDSFKFDHVEQVVFDKIEIGEYLSEMVFRENETRGNHGFSCKEISIPCG